MTLTSLGVGPSVLSLIASPVLVAAAVDRSGSDGPARVPGAYL